MAGHIWQIEADKGGRATVGVQTGTGSKIISQDKTRKVTEGEENGHVPSTKGMDENAKWTPGGHSVTKEVPGKLETVN